MSETRTQSSDWRLMSTAPKDGTFVLLSCDGMTGLGWWAKSQTESEWRSYSFVDQDNWAPCEPIAWMPAPEPLPWGISVFSTPAAAPAPQGVVAAAQAVVDEWFGVPTIGIWDCMCALRDALAAMDNPAPRQDTGQAAAGGPSDD